MPPLLRARAGSERQNRLKTIADSPGASPTPRSRTVTAAAWSSAAIRTTIGRSGSSGNAWSIALVTRLRRIRSTRRASTWARTGRSRLLDDDEHAALVGERPGGIDHAVGDVEQVDVLDVEQGGTGVEPADLEQVDQQGLEPVELGLEQLGGAGGGRVEVATRVVEHVAGHPHGRQRRAELVGHVGHEPPLHPAELLELADLALQVGRHLVERVGEPGEVVLAGDPEPFLEPAGRQPLGHPPRHPDRRHHLAGHQPGDARRRARGAGRPRSAGPG